MEWNQSPPDVGPHGEVSSAALVYYLTKTFRRAPKPGELWASQDCGPYLDIPIQQMGKDSSGFPIILDAWNRPFEYDNIRDDKSTPDGFTLRGPGDIRTNGNFSRGDPAKNEPVANFEPYDLRLHHK